MPQFIVSPFDRITEADLRHSCGPRIFAQADRLERTGHVVKADSEEGFLVGQVRGTWRRIEDVRVGAQGARFAPECTCGVGGYCRHAGALLLHWLRHQGDFFPESAEPGARARYATSSSEAMRQIGGLLSTRVLSPVEEFAALLQGYTVAQLREIAQKRKIAYPKSRGKAETVALLASALSSPESIDAALAELNSDELLALDVVHLCGPEATLYHDFDRNEGEIVPLEDVIGDIQKTLGGTSSGPPLATLVDRGLLFVRSPSRSRGEFLQVPRAVRVRLRSVDDLLARSPKLGTPTEKTTPQPFIDDLFLVVASALGAEGRRASTRGRREGGFRGWGVVPVRQKTQISPWHPRLDEKDRTFIAEQTGLSPAAGEFVVEMMLALGMLEANKGLMLRPERFQTYFQRPIADRWFMLGLAWQALDEWSEMLLICDAAGPFSLWAGASFLHHTSPLIPEAYAFRGFFTRLLARLNPDRWHRIDDLLALIRQLGDVDGSFFRLSPPTTYGPDHQPIWWLAERDTPEVALDLTAPDVLDRYYRADQQRHRQSHAGGASAAGSPDPARRRSADRAALPVSPERGIDRRAEARRPLAIAARSKRVAVEARISKVRRSRQSAGRPGTGIHRLV